MHDVVHTRVYMCVNGGQRLAMDVFIMFLYFILINLVIYCNRILIYSPASLELLHHDGLELGALSASTISVLELKAYITISGFPLLFSNYHYFMYMGALPTRQPV